VFKGTPLGWQDLSRFTGAILFGGLLGPVLLMVGLKVTPAISGSLLLNLEGAFTALLARSVFKQNFTRRLPLGMGVIIVASILVSWEERPAADPLQIACLTGLVAGPRLHSGRPSC
jgi:drug/metabolite transporter (DMT)-like permease